MNRPAVVIWAYWHTILVIEEDAILHEVEYLEAV